MMNWMCEKGYSVLRAKKEIRQAQENVENAVIAFKDNTVVMVIASNECTADLDSAVDSALGE